MGDRRSESFWNWAETKYSCGGVQDMCLDLQDNGDQSVPLLLWAAWCAASGVRIDEQVAGRAASIARIWSDAIIMPLRTMRRSLSTALRDSGDSDCEGLRESVKSAELEAEHALMNQLESLVPAGFASPTANLKANTLGALQVVTTAWAGVQPTEPTPDLTQALIKGKNLRYDA